MFGVLGLALDRGDPGIIPIWLNPLSPRINTWH
jgi:hypothetical protein